MDETKNSNFPCRVGSIAGAPAGSLQSGPLQAGAADKVLTFSTAGMSTGITFAVCYSEGMEFEAEGL